MRNLVAATSIFETVESPSCSGSECCPPAALKSLKYKRVFTVFYLQKIDVFTFLLQRTQLAQQRPGSCNCFIAGPNLLGVRFNKGMHFKDEADWKGAPPFIAMTSLYLWSTLVLVPCDLCRRAELWLCEQRLRIHVILNGSGSDLSFWWTRILKSFK